MHRRLYYFEYSLKIVRRFTTKDRRELTTRAPALENLVNLPFSLWDATVSKLLQNTIFSPAKIARGRSSDVTAPVPVSPSPTRSADREMRGTTNLTNPHESVLVSPAHSHARKASSATRAEYLTRRSRAGQGACGSLRAGSQWAALAFAHPRLVGGRYSGGFVQIREIRGHGPLSRPGPSQCTLHAAIGFRSCGGHGADIRPSPVFAFSAFFGGES